MLVTIHKPLRLLIVGALVAFALPVLLVPTAAALDCSGLEELECNGPAVSGTINLGGTAITTLCGAYTYNDTEQVFSITLATDQEVAVTVDCSVNLELFLLGSCDENDCVAVAAPSDNTLIACLEAGTYYLVAATLLELITSYEVSIDCIDCDPVAADVMQWGTVKAQYR